MGQDARTGGPAMSTAITGVFVAGFLAGRISSR
jgi:hypothetical protein